MLSQPRKRLEIRVPWCSEMSQCAVITMIYMSLLIDQSWEDGKVGGGCHTSLKLTACLLEEEGNSEQNSRANQWSTHDEKHV